jgi:hypothetical protein
MVLICPFIMKIYHKLLLHVIVSFKMDKITRKSGFQTKVTFVIVVAVYRNTMFIYQNTVHRSDKYAHISRWVRHCSVCRDAHSVVYQCLIVSVHTDIRKISEENDCLDMIVIFDIGLKN